ncbi:hypothetical protein AVEN_91165-1 [Araneus ventricosus]|uniref:Uncharacterized protein n=1 Tax=Araneus ventricosus TaxID=182803 RepID=A0A4Y2E733_ARAVE|nr:hypothetical protein AVEN_91165-1 [Araneus ventricosus]
MAINSPRGRIQEVLQETHDSSKWRHFRSRRPCVESKRFYWDVFAPTLKWVQNVNLQSRLKTEDGKSVTGWISAEKLSIEASFPGHSLDDRKIRLPRRRDLNKLGHFGKRRRLAESEYKLSRSQEDLIRQLETSFQKGDLVWMYNPKRRRGLAKCSNWEGPYTIVKN